MAFIHIERRCEECERTREELQSLRRQVQGFELDLNSWYEKIRTNLAKLAKREKSLVAAEDEPTNGDPLAKYRNALVERKLSRKG